MALVALVTLLLLLQYIVFQMLVGKARVEHGIKAPACTGHEMFDRAYRVHINTLEQLIIVIPAMWICAYFFRTDVAAGLGFLYLVGRIFYRAGYVKDPDSRGAGMGIGFIAYAGLIGCGLWGVISQLL